MEYRRFADTVIARIDKNEEIHEQLKKIALREGIRLASVNALGAVNDFSVGLFDTGEKQYYANTFSGDHEIVSLTGTVSTMDGEYYAHLHMSAADRSGRVVGGHLSRAVVGATCEMVIRVTDGTVERKFNEEIGLNLFAF